MKPQTMSFLGFPKVSPYTNFAIFHFWVMFWTNRRSPTSYRVSAPAESYLEWCILWRQCVVTSDWRIIETKLIPRMLISTHLHISYMSWPVTADCWYSETGQQWGKTDHFSDHSAVKGSDGANYTSHDALESRSDEFWDWRQNIA